jgi:hypothetical protein
MISSCAKDDMACARAAELLSLSVRRVKRLKFGRALQQLGIPFITARSPQAKGRVECLWGVLQDRLTSELRLAQATDLDSVHAVLRVFLTDYNRPPPREMQTDWLPAPENLESHLLLRRRTRGQQRQHRAVGRPAFSDPPARPTFQLCRRLYEALDGRVSLYYRDTRLQHTTNRVRW